MTRALTTEGDLSDLVRADAPLEVVATGFAYTEGAAWDAGARALLFSDLPIDATYRWTHDGGVAVP